MAAKFKACSVEGCNGNAHRVGHGFCRAHRARFERHGDPLYGGPIRIVAAKGDTEVWLQTHLGYSRDGCLAWPFAKRPDGYGKLTRDKVTYGAHRVMCEMTHGCPPTPEHQAAHSCGKGHEGCVNPRHLRWATKVENSADSMSHGTTNRGTRYPKAKLTEADVIEIRSLQGQMTTTVIGEKFGVSPTLISLLHRRKRWSWL